MRSPTAAPALDQSNEVYEFNHDIAIPVGQTFTVGTSGVLTRVDLGATAIDGVTLAVRAYQGGEVTGPDLASGPAVHDPVDNWASLELATPLPVVAGEQYAILVTAFTTFEVMYTDLDPNAGGALIQTHQENAAGGWYVHHDMRDQRFRTFVATELAPTLDGTPPNAVVGEDYTFEFDLTGWPEPEVALTAGTLPDGMLLDTDGTLHATPTESGTFPLTLTVSNGVDEDAVHTTELVVDALPTVTGDPTNATVDEDYTYALDVAGSPDPEVTTEDDLPAGLELTTDGVLHGTPTEAGTTTFTVTATNRAGEATHELTLTVLPVPEVVEEDEPAPPVPTGTDDEAPADDEPADETDDGDDEAPAASDGPLATTGSDLIGLARSSSLVLLTGVLLVVLTALRRTRSLHPRGR